MIKCARCGCKNDEKKSNGICKKCGASLTALIPDADTGNAVNRSQPYNGSNSVVVISDSQGSNGSFAASSDTNTGKNGKVKKAGKAGKLLLAAFIVAAVAALAILILAAVNSRGLYLPGGNSYTVLEHEDCLNVVYKGREALPHVMKSSAVLNADGTTVGVIDDEGMLYSSRGGTGHTVDSKVKDVKVCDNGKFMFYTSESDGKLWVYDCGKNDTPRCVCSEGVAPGFAVSCDGKWVVYNKLNSSGLYLCQASNGKEQWIGEGLKPVSVSNGAKQIFAYSEEDCSLYLVNKNGKGEPQDIKGGIGPVIWLNYDHTEVAFTSEASNGNVKTFVYKNGKKYEVAGGELAPVMTASMLPTALGSESFSAVTCPFSTFDEKLFFGRGIYSFTFKGCSPVFSGDGANSGKDDAEIPLVTKAVLSDDLKHLYFVFDSGLYHSVKSDYAVCEKVYDSCATLVCSNNGAVVWFIDEDGALLCLTGDDVAKAASNVSAFAVSQNGREAIYVRTGNAYYCRSSAPEKAKDLECRAELVAYDRRGMYVYDGVKWSGITNKGKLIDLNDD